MCTVPPGVSLSSDVVENEAARSAFPESLDVALEAALVVDSIAEGLSSRARAQFGSDKYDAPLFTQLLDTALTHYGTSGVDPLTSLVKEVGSRDPALYGSFVGLSHVLRLQSAIIAPAVTFVFSSAVLPSFHISSVEI